MGRDADGARSVNKDYAPLDEALDILKPFGPMYGGGLANHGPMAAEALCAMGRPEVVVPWVERYRRRLEPRSRGLKPVSRSRWRPALGRPDRVADWIGLFGRELREASWTEAVARWVPRLLPGIVAEAMHGAIRTAHAVRALSLEETPARLDELARALGYWAGTFKTLPEAPFPGEKVRAAAALREVPVLPVEKRRVRSGSITAALGQLTDWAPFRPVVAMLDTSGDSAEVLSDLTETFAGVFTTFTDDVLTAITFIHCVTGVAAARVLAGHVEPQAARAALRYAWQAAAGIYSARLPTRRIDRQEQEAIEDVDRLIDAAVATDDEHAIKFAEACLREHRLRPRPAYLAACSRATSILSS